MGSTPILLFGSLNEFLQGNTEDWTDDDPPPIEWKKRKQIITWIAPPPTEFKFPISGLTWKRLAADSSIEWPRDDRQVSWRRGTADEP